MPNPPTSILISGTNIIVTWPASGTGGTMPAVLSSSDIGNYASFLEGLTGAANPVYTGNLISYDRVYVDPVEGWAEWYSSYTPVPGSYPDPLYYRAEGRDIANFDSFISEIQTVLGPKRQ